MEQLSELYRDVILEHYKNSRHMGELPKPAISAEGENPLCGDELSVYLQQENGRVAQAPRVSACTTRGIGRTHG